MTDEQIIKALDMCSNWENDKTCEECPANVFDFSCANKTSKFALSLINRQKAETERYKGVIKILENDVANAKYEAIKEFAERLKSRLANLSVQTKTHGRKTTPNYVDDIANQILYDVVPEEIDKLVKEMTEVQE